MKKNLLSLIIVFLLPFLLLIVVGVVYQIRYSYVEYRSIKVLDAYFVKCNLPKAEIVDVTDEYQRILGNMLAWNVSVNKDVTTSKDFKNWQRLVKENGKLLNGQKIPNEDYLEEIKNCEIRYSASVSSRDIREKNVSYSFSWGGNGVIDEKFVKEHFAYLPPKEIFDKLVEEWRLSKVY